MKASPCNCESKTPLWVRSVKCDLKDAIMAPKRDLWSRSRTVKRSKFEAVLSLTVRGDAESSALQAAFSEFSETLERHLKTEDASLQEQSTVSSCAAEIHPVAETAKQDPHKSEDALLAADVVMEEQSPATSSSAPQVPAVAETAKSDDGAEVRAKRKGARGPSLRSKKCAVDGCDLKPYARVSAVLFAAKFKPASESQEVCRKHYPAARRKAGK